MKELERVKEFMETLEFHGYIDHDSTKLNELIDDYYPLKQGQTLPIDSVSVSSFSKEELEQLAMKKYPKMMRSAGEVWMGLYDMNKEKRELFIEGFIECANSR